MCEPGFALARMTVNVLTLAKVGEDWYASPMRTRLPILTALLSSVLTACLPQGEKGNPGAPGLTGKDGAHGEAGPPGPHGKDSTVSGSRLKAVYRTAADGAREAVGWFDTVTDQRCSFIDDNDGATICAPAYAPPGIAIAYSDATCSSPVALIVPKADQEALATIGPYITMMYGRGYYKTAGAAPTGPYYHMAGAVCNPYELTTADPGWISAAEIELEFFVHAKNEIE
jgi:hypothetical protein